MYGDETVVGQMIPTPPRIAKKVEGLPTSGPMGTVPTLTVAGLVSLAGFGVNLAVQYFGWELPTDLRIWADQYGVMLATIVVPLITGVISYFKVFAPKSVAEIQAGVR